MILINEVLIKKEELKEEVDEKIISLYYDRAFKLIFNNSKQALAEFLSVVTNIQINDNINIEIGSEALGKFIDGKKFSHDMVVNVDDKIYICLEMNANKYAYSIDRNLIYLADYMVSLVPKGMDVKDLSKYRLILINLNMFPNRNGKIIERLVFGDLENGEAYTNLFEVINFDIEKCYDLLYNGSRKEKRDKLVRWGSIFKANTIQEIDYILGDDLLIMEEREEFLENIRAANNDKELVAALRSERNERWKRQSIENGLREEGKEEISVKVIKNMLKEKLSYDFITKMTGKTISEIKAIESNI